MTGDKKCKNADGTFDVSFSIYTEHKVLSVGPLFFPSATPQSNPPARGFRRARGQ